MEHYSTFELIQEFQKRLVQKYNSENLNCIAGLDYEFKINGEQVNLSFVKAVEMGQKLYKPENKNDLPKFDYNKIRADLKAISDEILHFTGLAYLYYEFLSSPLDFPINLRSGEIVYANNQGLPEQRFYMYVTAAYEKLYNYWDRIGDLLASFFPELIKPDKVYFSKIDKFIPKIMQSEENIKWLIDFKRNQYQTLNNFRIKIVHYENLDTTFSSEHLRNYNNHSKLKQIVDNRNHRISDLKNHIDFTLKGFVKTIRFMEFLNDNVLNDENSFNEKKMAVYNTRS